MEKTAEFQFTVTNRKGKLFLKPPGGNEIPYDGRFSNLPHIAEGDSFIVPLGD